MNNRVFEILENILKITNAELIEGIDDENIWDSLAKVEVVFAIEDELGIYLNDNEVAQSITPRKLIEIVQRKENEA